MLKKPLTIITAALAIAGCSAAAPTAPNGVPDRPAFDGGHGFGSGNFVNSDSTTAAGTSFETTAESDTTGRTGHGFGSGN